MSAPVNNLQWLQALCHSFADGEWEHGYGCKIQTLDNPGWRLEFTLLDTPLADASFERVEVQRSERDWFFCWIADNRFQLACGPRNLDEALSVFREWVAQSGVSISTGSQT